MIRNNRTAETTLLLCLLTTALTAFRSSEYYRNRLRYSPHFIYYQRQYILKLAAERKIRTALRWIEKYKKQEQEPGRSTLLKGILLAAAGRLQQARKIWRSCWPYGRRQHHYLEREYKQQKLTEDLFQFYSYLSTRYPANSHFLKRSCIYSIYSGNTEALSSRVKNILSRRLFSPETLAQSIAPHLMQIQHKQKYLYALDRIGTREIYFRIQVLIGNARKAALTLIAGIRNSTILLKTALSLTGAFRKLKRKEIYFDLISNLPEKRLQPVDRLALARHLEQSRPEKAQKIYLSLINADTSLRGLSRIQLHKNNLSKAYAFQLRIRKPEQKDWRLRGIILALKNNLTEALKAFQNLFSEERALHTALALIAAGKKQQEAVSALLQGLNNPGGDGKAIPALRLLYHLKYIQLNSEEKKLAATAIQNYWTGRMLHSAKILSRIATRREGESSALFYFAAARLAVQEKKTTLALLWLQKTVSKKSSIRDRALFHLARIYKYRLKRTREAGRLFMQIIEKYPDSLYLYESRKELKP